VTTSRSIRASSVASPTTATTLLGYGCRILTRATALTTICSACIAWGDHRITDILSGSTTTVEAGLSNAINLYDGPAGIGGSSGS
jgi:hypothetical protein